MFDYKLEYVGTSTGKLGPIEIIGPVPEGFRINAYIASGEFVGPGFKAKTRPGGGDWLTIRTDGVGILDVRCTTETEDGALIYCTYSGVMDLGEDGYKKLLAGEPLPNGVPIRATPRMYTSHPNYLSVNRLQCLAIGVGDLGRGEVTYEIYVVV
jgi:hypothetical protein